MAKKTTTNKSESDKPMQTPPKQTPPKQAEAKKPAAAAATTAATSSPQIDTSLAANAAAALVGNKAPLTGSGGPKKKESAAFKQLKAGLNKPSAGALGGAFGPGGQSKKSHQPFGGGKQTGHSQTFGADVNRSGVPRRTPG